MLFTIFFWWFLVQFAVDSNHLRDKAPLVRPSVVGRPCPIDAKKRRLLCLD
jgi:hypothetical protein